MLNGFLVWNVGLTRTQSQKTGTETVLGEEKGRRLTRKALDAQRRDRLRTAIAMR